MAQLVASLSGVVLGGGVMVGGKIYLHHLSAHYIPPYIYIILHIHYFIYFSTIFYCHLHIQKLIKILYLFLLLFFNF